MTTDAKKMLKYIVDESKRHKNEEVEVNIGAIKDIPNIRYSKNKLLDELETAGFISGYDTNEHGEIQVYLTSDGLEYFDNLEKKKEKVSTSIVVNVSGGQVNIANKTIEAVQNNKIKDYQDSSKEKASENVNKVQCNVLDDIKDEQGHTDIVLSDSVDNNSAKIDDCQNDFRKDECIHESAKKSGAVNNNETVMVAQKSIIWGKFVPSLLLLLICLFILIGCFASIFDKDKKITILDDIVVSQNQPDLTIRDKYIDKDAIKKLNKLKNLTKLEFERCNFEHNVLYYINLPLECFCMTDCTNVTRYDFINSMDNLHELKLQNCGVTNHELVFFYVNKGISSICIADNAEFSDLSNLPLSNLLDIDFSGTSVYDLSPLSICENLTQINGSNTLVSDLKPLANLEKLTTMQFDHCAIQEIKDEFLSLRMRNISFECNSITDCSGFSNFTILENVNLSNNELSDISWIEKSKETLKIVALSNNLLEQEQISFLSDCKSLQEVYLNGIQMSSLNIIDNMQELKKIEAIHCGIQDISALKGLSELQYVHLAQNEIIDISALNEMGSQTAEFDLAYNNITNISYLPQESNLLVLFGNPISLNKNNFGQMFGNIIVMDYKQDMLNYSINFQDIYIVDCPMDKRVKLENALRHIHFLTQEEAFQMLETKYNIHY